MKQLKYQISKFTVIIALVVGAILLFLYFPFQDENIQMIQSNLITVSGILTGIVIAYLFAKQFLLIQKREEKQKEINVLSEKLTLFRKILYRVMNSHDFWINYGDIKKYKQKYKDVSFSDLHGNPKEKKELARKFWLDEKDICSTTADLYLSMEEITGPIETGELWAYERTNSYTYSLDYLRDCHMPSNQIWYYLKGRYGKHTKGLINDKAIWVLFKNDVTEFASQIDKKYKERDFDRHLLGDIGTDFHEEYIPRLIDLTNDNSKGLSKSMTTLIVTLTVILIFGVIIPLFIQTIDLKVNFSKIITFSSVLIVIAGLTNFLFDFYRMLNKEIELKD